MRLVYSFLYIKDNSENRVYVRMAGIKKNILSKAQYTLHFYPREQEGKNRR
jgi:hypothetical protein